MKPAEWYNIPVVGEPGEGYKEKRYRRETFRHCTYLTEKSMQDTEYMADIKETLAQDTIRAFAEFIRENPECVEVHKSYDAGRASLRFDTQIHVLIGE